MLNGWYYHKKHGQRLLPVKTIAADCDCEVDEVEEWFGDKIIYSALADGGAVDAGEVVSFLVRNSMPVYSSLLPPNSRKILIITTDTPGIERHRRYIEPLLSYFKKRCNLLVDNASSGKFADLTILTFAPDVVMYFLQGIDRTTISTLALLSNFPELSTILVGDKSVLQNLHADLTLPKHCLTISNSLAEDRLEKLLNSAFGKH